MDTEITSTIHWIRVAERNPTDGTFKLVVTHIGDVREGYYSLRYERWHVGDKYVPDFEVIYWADKPQVQVSI